MATFGDVQEQVVSLWSGFVDVPEDILRNVAKYVNLAQQHAQDHHYFRCMELLLSANTTPGAILLVAKPTSQGRWREWRDRPYLLRNDGYYEHLDWLPAEFDTRIYYSQAAADTGPPRYLYETATDIQIFPLPDANSDYGDGNYRVRVPYFGYLADLSTITDVNWFTTNAEQYLIFAAAGFGFERMGRHDLAALWGLNLLPQQAPQGKADRELRRLIRVDKLSRLPNTISLIPRADKWRGARTGRY